MRREIRHLTTLFEPIRLAVPKLVSKRVYDLLREPNIKGLKLHVRAVGDVPAELSELPFPIAGRFPAAS